MIGTRRAARKIEGLAEPGMEVLALQQHFLAAHAHRCHLEPARLEAYLRDKAERLQRRLSRPEQQRLCGEQAQVVIDWVVPQRATAAAARWPGQHGSWRAHVKLAKRINRAPDGAAAQKLADACLRPSCARPSNALPLYRAFRTLQRCERALPFVGPPPYRKACLDALQESLEAELPEVAIGRPSPLKLHVGAASERALRSEEPWQLLRSIKYLGHLAWCEGGGGSSGGYYSSGSNFSTSGATGSMY